MRDRWKRAYGVVDVGTDHETFTTAMGTVVDGYDVTGLFIVRCVLCVRMQWVEVESEMNESGMICVRSS